MPLAVCGCADVGETVEGDVVDDPGEGSEGAAVRGGLIGDITMDNAQSRWTMQQSLQMSLMMPGRRGCAM